MGKYGHLIKRVVGGVDYWTQAAMRRFVLEIDRRMRDQSMSRALLAEKLSTSPAYVTKVMRGDVNFTLETMTKLALAVGGRLQIEIVDGESRWRPAEWRHGRHEMAPVVQTETIRIAHRAANQSAYDYETLAGQAA